MLRKLLTLTGMALALAVTGFAPESALPDAIAKTSRYQGGILSLHPPQGDNAWLPGNAASLAVRFRAPSERVESRLAVLRDAARDTLFSLSLERVEGAPQLRFDLRTDWSDVPLRLAVPVATIGAAR